MKRRSDGFFDQTGSDMKRLVLIATLLSSPASAQFYSYDDFDRQPLAIKYSYPAGEVDMFLVIEASGAKRFDVGECIRDAKISIKEIAQLLTPFSRRSGGCTRETSRQRSAYGCKGA
jgi:hypothetical protein